MEKHTHNWVTVGLEVREDFSGSYLERYCQSGKGCKQFIHSRKTYTEQVDGYKGDYSIRMLSRKTSTSNLKLLNAALTEAGVAR